MKARKKEMLEVQHPRMKSVFDRRNTKQSQELMDLRSRDLENDSDWYVWRFYVDTVATQVGKLRTLIEDLDDKLDEQGAILRKGELNDWVFEYRENKQALLHNVDLMLDLTNKEKQRQLSRSVTEWKEFFAELEASWGYWFPDVKTLMKGPKDETDKTKLRQEASGTSTNAAMRCTQTRKLKQSSFNPTKRNGSEEATSEKKSLTQSSRVTDEERRVVGASNPSDVIKSIWDVKVLPEESNKGSVKATSRSNQTTASSKSSNAKRILLLELEAMKKQDEIDEQLAAARRKAEIRRKQHEIDTLTEKLEIARLEEESARTKQVANQEKELARIGIRLRPTQSQKETKQLQPSKCQQECYRTFKAIWNSTKPLTGTELREQSAHSRKDRHGVANKESHLRNNKELCFGQIDSKSIVGSHLRSNRESVESSSTMTIVKQFQPRHTSSEESSGDRNELLKRRKDELLGKQEERASLKALDCTTKGKCTVKKWKPEQMKCSDKCPNHGKLQDKTFKREAHEDSNMTNIESNANKGTSKNLIAEWMWNWPETFFVDNGWQDFQSEILLVDTEQVLEEEIHLVMSEHLVVQTEETLDYRMTETMQEHRSLAFASNNETSEEFSVQLELLQVMAEVSTILQDVRQGKLFQVTVFYDITLLLEERNKCYEFVKCYDFVNEQRYTLPEELNEIVMYRKLCHVAMKHDNPAKGNAKIETQIVNATFGKKTDFDFNESLLEETILSHRNVWNHWIGNGNSGMDAVAQANVIDETQLSNGHRKQSKRRIWKIEHNWNLIHGTEERSQLNGNGTRDDTFWLHDLTDNVSVTRTQMCSLKVPATSWTNGSCNGPATPFMAMGTQYGSIGKLEVSDDLSEPCTNPDDNKFVFCGERSSVTLYKQQRKRNSTALQLLGENVDEATKNDVSLSKELNVVQRLSLKHKSIPIGYTENIEHKEKNSSRCNVGNSLYLLVMMMDDSKIAAERQIESLSMEQLENELTLIYLPRGQSTLMRNNVAEQILGIWLKTFSTYLEIYSLDVEVIMEVELNGLKHFGNDFFEGSQEKQLVELNECWTSTIKFGIIGKTITSNETTVFWKYFVLWQLVENNCMVSEMDYELEKHSSRERTQQTNGKLDYETEVRRKTTTIEDKLKRPVVRLAPLFYESVFREKNRAGNVGASPLRDQKLKLERD